MVWRRFSIAFQFNIIASIAVLIPRKIYSDTGMRSTGQEKRPAGLGCLAVFLRQAAGAFEEGSVGGRVG